MKARKRVLRYSLTGSRTNRLIRADALAADTLLVASSVFEAEKMIRKGSRVARLELPLYRRWSYSAELLREAIEGVILYVLAEETDTKLFARYASPPALRKRPDLEPVKNVCLFSGGVDSFCGVLLVSAEEPSTDAAFCAHSDQGKIVTIVDELATKAIRPLGVNVRKISVPPAESHGYTQLRGFLYCVAASAWIHLLRADRLIVTECGPTMYQPRFSPLDAVTMTTHPVVLSYARRVINELLGREITLVTPFEDFTKAEMLAICPLKEFLPQTHSCISQRFGKHDGTCYGCVIRRLGALAAGVPDVEYEHNPIAEESAHSGNLMSLLSYCHDLLTDYRNMREYEVEKIERYGKRDLFRRFALDQFAAIHRLVRRRMAVQPGVHRLYDSVRARMGDETLAERLRVLKHFSPAINLERTPLTRKILAVADRTKRSS